MNLQGLQKMTYGMYVVGSKKDDKINAFLANSVFQITSEPATLAVSVNKINLTSDFINHSKVFSISVITEEADMKFIGNFGFRSGRDINKFESINYKLGEITGAPIVLDNSCASIEANLVSTLDMGTHTIFIGEIVDTKILSDKKPMTYSYYHEVIKGKTAKTAPTYVG